MYRGMKRRGAVLPVYLISALLHSSLPALAIDMPPPSQDRREVYETLYKLEFLEDGMPGRRTESGIVPHPIYPAYVVADYLAQWQETKDRIYLDAAKRVTDAALSRMEDFKGSLVFWYSPEMGLAAAPGTFYSGLTQARYLKVFEAMAEATGDHKYREAADRVLRSLMISVAEGGVARPLHDGIVIEEWPYNLMGIYTLNGWITAMVLVAEYAEASGSHPAMQFFGKNVAALETLIQNFDVPELANTRYSLAGYAYMRVVFAGGEGTINSAKIKIPGEGTFAVSGETEKTRWANFFMDSPTGQAIRMNVVLSCASMPRANILRLELSADTARTALVQIMGGEYTPTKTRQANTGWITLAEVQVHSEGEAVEVPIPWNLAGLVGYPTAFTKVIGGKRYNSYHYIHMRQIKRIAELSGNAKLAAYAVKWAAYPERWAQMPVYRDAPIELAPYQAGR